MQINSPSICLLLVGALLVSAERVVVAAEPGALPQQADDSAMPWLPPVADEDSEVDLKNGESADGPAFGLQAQLWWQRSNLRAGDGNHSDLLRMVLDWRHEWTSGARTRFGISDKFEQIVSIDAAGHEQATQTSANLLRELWVSRQFGNPSQLFYLDFGRINQRGGSGSGYNPTDYFKARSVVSATSLDPNSLRVDRLGTVMLRAQSIGASGTLTIALVPKLESPLYQIESTRRGDFSLDLDRTNALRSAYVRFAPQLSERIALDLIGFSRAGEKPQTGANLSTLLSDTLVANIEWSGGRRRPLPLPEDASTAEAWSNRLAANLTWTSSNGIELTAERIFAGDAFSRSQWKAWRAVDSAPQFQRLRRVIAERSLLQEPLVQDGWFARGAWRDAWSVRGLQLSSFVLANAYDGSALWQFSASYSPDEHWTFSGLFGRYVGDSNSEFGGSRESGFVSVNLTRHL